jgi:hypothetical protein
VWCQDRPQLRRCTGVGSLTGALDMRGAPVDEDDEIEEEDGADAGAAALANAMDRKGRPGATALVTSRAQREALAQGKRLGGARWEEAARQLPEAGGQLQEGAGQLPGAAEQLREPVGQLAEAGGQLRGAQRRAGAGVDWKDAGAVLGVEAAAAALKKGRQARRGSTEQPFSPAQGPSCSGAPTDVAEAG